MIDTLPNCLVRCYSIISYFLLFVLAAKKYICYIVRTHFLIKRMELSCWKNIYYMGIQIREINDITDIMWHHCGDISLLSWNFIGDFSSFGISCEYFIIFWDFTNLKQYSLSKFFQFSRMVDNRSSLFMCVNEAFSWIIFLNFYHKFSIGFRSGLFADHIEFSIMTLLSLHPISFTFAPNLGLVWFLCLMAYQPL